MADNRAYWPLLPNSERPHVCAQAGCAVCLEALLRRHEGLVHVILRRQWRGEVAYVDLLQEGRIGLWQAIKHFDPHRGVAFSSYAGRAIERFVVTQDRVGRHDAVVRLNCCAGILHQAAMRATHASLIGLAVGPYVSRSNQILLIWLKRASAVFWLPHASRLRFCLVEGSIGGEGRPTPGADAGWRRADGIGSFPKTDEGASHVQGLQRTERGAAGLADG